MGKAWIAADGLGVDSSAVECKAKSWYPKKPILKTHTMTENVAIAIYIGLAVLVGSVLLAIAWDYFERKN